jgi:hypothetical protein
MLGGRSSGRRSGGGGGGGGGCFWGIDLIKSPGGGVCVRVSVCVCHTHAAREMSPANRACRNIKVSREHVELSKEALHCFPCFVALCRIKLIERRAPRTIDVFTQYALSHPVFFITTTHKTPQAHMAAEVDREAAVAGLRAKATMRGLLQSTLRATLSDGRVVTGQFLVRAPVHSWRGWLGDAFVARARAGALVERERAGSNIHFLGPPFV